MKFKNTIFSILKSSCVIFTIISLIVISLSDLARTTAAANPSASKSLWTFFAFSLILACINRILKAEKISLGARMFLHFLSCAVLYYVVILLIAGFGSNGKQTIVGLLLFTIVYLVFAVIYGIYARKQKKKKGKKSKYESIIK